MGSSIEDVLINNNYNKKKKSGHPFLLILIFLLLIILCVLLYFRFFYVDTQQVDYREEFFEYTATNNSKFFLNDTLYSEILKKLETRSYEANSSINFSTTKKISELEDIDVGKLLINVDFLNRKDDEKKFFDLNVRYLDNEIVNGKLIEQNDEVYVTSEDIINMYIGGNKKDFYPILSEILSKEINFSKIDDFKNLLKNRIEYSDLDIPKYYKIIRDNVEVSNIQKKDNVIIQKEDENITTEEYELKLSKEQVNTILQKLLEVIKEDKTLLNKLVVTKSNFNEDTKITRDLTPVGETEELTNPESAISTNENPDANENSSEENTNNENTIQNEETDGIQRIQNDNLSASGENQAEDSTSLENNTVIKANVSENLSENEDIESSNSTLSKEEALEMLKSLLTGNNKDATLKDIQNAIQTIIDNIDELQESGILLKIYVSRRKHCKVKCRF